MHKAVCEMSSKVDIQRNKLMHLENTLPMFGGYNVETLEKLIKTVHTSHSRQSMYVSLFAGQITKAYEYYLWMHGDHGTQHYAINSMLYLRMIKDKYIEMYNEFISQICKSNYNFGKRLSTNFSSYTIKTTRNFSISKRNTD